MRALGIYLLGSHRTSDEQRRSNRVGRTNTLFFLVSSLGGVRALPRDLPPDRRNSL